MNPSDISVFIDNPSYGFRLHEANLSGTNQYYLRFSFSKDGFNQDANDTCRVRISQRDRELLLTFKRPNTDSRPMIVGSKAFESWCVDLIAGISPRDGYSRDLEDPYFVVVGEGKSWIWRPERHLRDPSIPNPVPVIGGLKGKVYEEGRDIDWDSKIEWFESKLSHYKKNHTNVRKDQHHAVAAREAGREK